MPTYKAYLTVYHCIYDIEADSPEEAEELASTDYIWDDHIKDIIIDIEEDDDDANV
jgi:hypothetical protein